MVTIGRMQRKRTAGRAAKGQDARRCVSVSQAGSHLGGRRLSPTCSTTEEEKGHVSLCRCFSQVLVHVWPHSGSPLHAGVYSAVGGSRRPMRAQPLLELLFHLEWRESQ